MKISNMKHLLQFWEERGNKEEVIKLLRYIQNQKGIILPKAAWDDPLNTGIKLAIQNLDNRSQAVAQKNKKEENSMTNKKDKTDGEETVAAQFGFKKGNLVVVLMEIVDEEEMGKYMKSAINYGEELPGMKVLCVGQLSESFELKQQLNDRKKDFMKEVEKSYEKIIDGIDQAITDLVVERGSNGQYYSMSTNKRMGM